MNVVIAVGGTSQKIINSLKTSADNVNFYTYNSIGSLIKESNLRKLTFDRIIMSKAIISNSNPEKEFESLNSYVKNFSNFSEIVFIVDTNGAELQEKFLRVFNSSMYLCAMMSKASVSAMLDIVKKPMEDLRKVYCNDSEENDKILVAGVPQQPKEEQKPKPEKQDKKGFFEGLGFGRKKVKPEQSESKVERVATNGEEIASVKNEDSTPENSVEITTDVPNPFSDEDSGSNNTSNSFFSDDEVRSPFGDDAFSDEEISYDDLAVGDFGRDHSDTGYLNEEEEEELKQFAELKANNQVQQVEKEDSLIVDDFDDVPDEVFIDEEPIEEIHTDEMLTGVSLLLSSNGRYEYAWECALNSVSNARKALVVDLYGGVLSLLNLHDYYNRGSGYSNMYVSRGVAFASCGLGVSSKLSDIQRYIDGWRREFNDIIIDCPIWCLDCLVDYDGVYISCDGSIHDMLNISRSLTNRTIVPLEVERKVSSDCKVIGDLDSEVVEEVKDVCMFANGCWL